MATRGTCESIRAAGLPATEVLKLQEGRPNILDVITNGEVDMVVNTPASSTESHEDDSYIRKAAIKAHIPYMTTMAAAQATALGIQTVNSAEGSEVLSLQDIHAKIR